MEPPGGLLPARKEKQNIPLEGATLPTERIEKKISYAIYVTAPSSSTLNPIYHEREKVIVKHTTHNGMTTMIFKSKDYYGIMAKIRVEVNLLKTLPDSVFIGQEYEDSQLDGYTQKLEYEGIPKYCKHCRKLGHNVIECRALEKKNAKNMEEVLDKSNEQPTKNKVAGKEDGHDNNIEKDETETMKNQKSVEIVVKDFLSLGCDSLSAITDNGEKIEDGRRRSEDPRQLDTEFNANGSTTIGRCDENDKHYAIQGIIPLDINQLSNSVTPKGGNKGNEGISMANRTSWADRMEEEAMSNKITGSTKTLDPSTKSWSNIVGSIPTEEGLDLIEEKCRKYMQEEKEKNEKQQDINAQMAVDQQKERKEAQKEDMKSSGAFFTCNNKQGGSDRVYSRIDRVLVNNEWILALLDSEVYYRNEGTFDHCPAIIRWVVDQKKQYIFRYFNMWSLAPEYKEKVKQGWKTNKNGTKIYELVGKFNSLKSKLRQLNKEKFSHIEKQIDQVQEELMHCQQRLKQKPLNQELQEEETRLIKKYKRLKEDRNQYLSQKSKVQWLKKGDLNTKYFHSMMKARRNINRVFSITDSEGVNETEIDAIAKGFIDFYTTLFGTSNRKREHVNSGLVRQGPTVTEVQNGNFRSRIHRKRGLSINTGKSNMFSANMPKQVLENICEATGYQKGNLPFRYLGIPISAKKLSIMDCEVLVDKMTARIKTWRSRNLSYAGRVQLINSVVLQRTDNSMIEPNIDAKTSRKKKKKKKAKKMSTKKSSVKFKLAIREKNTKKHYQVKLPSVQQQLVASMVQGSQQENAFNQDRAAEGGMRSKKAIYRLKLLININKVVFVAIFEPFGDMSKICGYKRFLGFKHCKANVTGKIRHLGHYLQACPVKNREFEAQKRKEEEAAAAASSQSNNQQKTTENVEASKQQQNNRQKEKANKGGEDQIDNTKVAEHQKEKQHQSNDTTPQKDEWQIQKRKNFKSTSQNKKQQQMYLPKEQANQSSAGISAQYTAPNKSSGIIQATHTVSQNANANTIVKDSVVQNRVSQSHSPHVSLSDKEVQGRMEKSQEKPIENQEGVPSGVGIPHVLQKCANAQLVDHRLDCVPPATSVPISETQHVYQSFDEVEHCEVISSEEELPNQEDDQVRRLLKGKAHASTDFNIQAPKPKNKPSQKRRKAMRKQNAGISINEPPDDTHFLSPAIQKSFRPDPNAIEESLAYRNSVIVNPSLSQPLLPNNEPTLDGNKSDLPTNDENLT
ncbi:hypothetical protein A4A49_07321 [Nicotiana attenuata]|uniref:DUF4283 domain-containing protein n=1 Tax=Nicotiana attenuata TaxID=49451 RepID=A0A1J6IF33_NICAT|nr:hypothetical protein A4A49_07321 [Nicotiana attenuata]